MSPSKMIHWGGLALMLGGLTLAAHYLTHPPVETSKYGLDPMFVLCHWLGGIAYMLIPLGFAGLYLRQSDRIGLMGLGGIILTYFACILLAGAQIFASVLVPFLALRGLDWVDFPYGVLFTSPVLQLYVALEVVAHLLGMLLVGIATLRVGVLPRWSTWIVIITVPIGVILVTLFFTVSTAPMVQQIGQVIFGGLLGLGLIGWGWALWSDQRARVMQSSALA
jgi:hypothetical protein